MPINLSPIERKAIRSFSQRLKKLLGKRLVSVLLFGSKARGNFHAGSDIDIFILVTEKSPDVYNKISELTAEIWEERGVSLSPVAYSVYEQEKNLAMHSFFFEVVQKEGIPL